MNIGKSIDYSSYTFILFFVKPSIGRMMTIIYLFYARQIKKRDW